MATEPDKTFLIRTRAATYLISDYRFCGMKLEHIKRQHFISGEGHYIICLHIQLIN
jgi:hypothetical protein